MTIWDARLIAADDQLGAAIRTFAALSRHVYEQYQQAGFSEEQSMDLVEIWNAEFAGMLCRTS